jgi:solute carrier family 25 protein 34/35
MYNQPTKQLPDGRVVGTLYKNPIDCLWKTFKTEGIYGWYKGRQAHKQASETDDLINLSGSTAHFLRIAPHT